jgi:peptidoglycan-associated lipoprotein
MSTFKAGLIAVSTLFLVAACSSTPQASNTNADQANVTKSNNDTATQSVSSANMSSSSMANGSDHGSAGMPAKRSVYFDFDRYVLKPEAKPVITSNAQYITAHNVPKIIIQGNTDERGGSEYNLALGQKRADAVRHELALLGVPNNEMEAISFGKEKPRATGHDEAAWAENRRADIVEGK